MPLIYFYKFRLSKPPRILIELLIKAKIKTNYSTYDNGVNYAY